MKKKETTEDMQAAENFFKEISADVKSDNLKKIWDNYGLQIVIAIVIILTAAVSFETFKAWKDKRAQTWSNAYAYALDLQNRGQFDDSIKILQQINEQNNGIYSDMVQMQISNILFEQGKNSEAIAELEKIVNNKDADKQIHDIAVIKLASYKLDNAPKEEVLALLEPLIKEKGSWSSAAQEMTAWLAIRDGDLESAKKIYSSILNTPNLNDGLKLRVQDVMSVLNSDN